ncbi:hypothetical protein ABTX34_35720 [Streptomyces sp. NPDC096538]|uniref:hypothetical protein n=1 Tax=Streptomyces sp. NPDC096538 TaxID=3155427 RepID=UPI003333852B
MDKIRVRVLRLGAGRPRKRPDSIGADKAYSNSLFRSYLRRSGVHVIPQKSDSRTARWCRGSDGGRPSGFYKARNTVERPLFPPDGDAADCGEQASMRRMRRPAV